MEKTIKILDTNVLLDYPQVVTKVDEYWIIPYCVLREIDGLKMSNSQQTAQKARRAAVYISKNMDNIEWDMTPVTNDVDSTLLEIAKEHDGTLVTNDVALKVRANIEKIKTEGYSWKGDYTGIYYLDVAALQLDQYNEILAELWNGNFIDEDYDFSFNEYLIVPSFDGTDKGETIFRFNGQQFVNVRGKEIENSWSGSIYPRNCEQICLVDLLLNNEIKIVYAGGVYGSGKTLLTHNYAIRELEKERIKKIIYVPNNAYTQDSIDLGALPGC